MAQKRLCAKGSARSSIDFGAQPSKQALLLELALTMSMSMQLMPERVQTASTVSRVSLAKKHEFSVAVIVWKVEELVYLSGHRVSAQYSLYRTAWGNSKHSVVICIATLSTLPHLVPQLLQRKLEEHN